MMENKKAEILNSKAAREESKAGEAVAALRLRKGMRVADIGCGGGYFSLLLAKAVGSKGRVFMADTDPKMLDYATALARENGANNAIAVLAEESDPRLPKKADVIFIRSACHHMENRTEYFRTLARYLLPGGRVALIDYRKGRVFSFRWLFGHYVESGVVQKEMEEAGFSLEKSFDFIKRQWFMVFKKGGAGI